MTTDTPSARIPQPDDDEPGLPTEGIARIKFEELTFEKLIGEGNYGDVHKGKYFDVTCAIKQIILDDKEYFKYIKREIRILSQMRHPFILQFLGVCEHGADIFIVTEYLSSGDVTSLLEKEGDIPWSLRLSIMTQLCQAMIYLHSKSIIHRDLKPDNILIDEHDNIRLADFGLARVLDTTTRERALTICGTDGFIAPEVMLGMNYSPQCDVFSYGMVLAQVITRLEPGEDYWRRGETGDLGLNDEEFIALTPADTPPELRDLTLGCGAFDADDRPSFNDVLGVLKYVNTKLAMHLARPTLVAVLGTLSRKTLRDTGAGVLPQASPAATPNANSSTSTAAGASTTTLPPMDDKSTQMLLFHVMKLVQRSTNEDYSDAPYAEDFLLTYPEFLEAHKLLSLLCQRWQHAGQLSAQSTDPKEIAELQRRTKLIRLRTLAFVKMWIGRHLADFATPNMREQLARFDALARADGLMKKEDENATMSALVVRRMTKGMTHVDSPTLFTAPPPKSYPLPASLTFMTVSAVEVARQLTLLQHRLFAAIDMRDLLREVWKKRPQCAAAQFANNVERFRMWLVTNILRADKPPVAITRCVELAAAMLSLQNFNGLFAVLAALSHPSVKRLRRVWAQLPNATSSNNTATSSSSSSAAAAAALQQPVTANNAMAQLAQLRLFEQNDFERYRKLNPSPPGLPHFSAALDEIVYVETTSDPRLPSGIINFRRFRHVGQVCRQLALFQQAPFNLTPLPALITWLEKDMAANVLDDEAVKRLSLQLEPPV